MPTLILTPRQTDDAQSLWRAALAQNWDVHRLTTWRIPDELRPAPEPVLYVEALFGPTLAEQLGVQLVSPPEDWLPGLPFVYRRRDVQLSTLGHARRLPAAAFIKPPNDKSFPAAVYEPSELPRSFEDDMTVLVSDPVRFISEFRCFVLDRRLRAFSLYAREGTPCPDEVHTDLEARELADFIATMFADTNVVLPRACALDVGVVDGRGWSVVELNAAWGAGIYQCDPEAVLDVVRAATISRRESAE